MSLAMELTVFNKLFAGLAEAMGIVLRRRAFSPNIKERWDYSAAVFADRGELLAQAAHIPVHLGALPLTKALSLDFIPVVTERYDLVVPETTFADERFQNLLAIIRSEEFKTAVAALGGYDTKDTGAVMYEQ